MKRLLAEETVQTFESYDELVNKFGISTVQEAVCKAMETIFLNINNDYIANNYLEEKNSAMQNHHILEMLDENDIGDLIIHEGYQKIVAETFTNLHIPINNAVDIADLGDEIFEEWMSYDTEVRSHLIFELTQDKWAEIVKNYPQYFKEELYASSIYDLEELKDSVGEHVYVKDDIDFDCRDNAFLYLDDVIVWGEQGKSHTQTLLQYNQERDKETEISDKWHRMEGKEIQKLNQIEAVGFGHYGKNVAVVDKEFENCTDTDVKNALLKQSEKTIKKVYLQTKTHLLERIARNVIGNR